MNTITTVALVSALAAAPLGAPTGQPHMQPPENRGVLSRQDIQPAIGAAIESASLRAFQAFHVDGGANTPHVSFADEGSSWKLSRQAVASWDEYMDELQTHQDNRRLFFGDDVEPQYRAVSVESTSAGNIESLHKDSQQVIIRISANLTQREVGKPRVIALDYIIEYNENTHTIDRMTIKSDRWYDHQQPSPDAISTGDVLLGDKTSSQSGQASSWDISESKYVRRGPGDVSTRSLSARRAVRYAQRHATSPNKSEYSYYSGRDCANFVSQALHAGGWKMTPRKNANSDRSWWSHNKKNSYGWHNAEGLYRVMRFVKKRPGIDNIWDAQPGDVIQYKKKSDKNMRHTMIVVDREKVPNKDMWQPILAQHSGNTSRRTLSNAWDDGSKWFFATDTF